MGEGRTVLDAVVRQSGKPQMISETISSRGGPEDFSLVLGGPLFQLMRRTHLSDDALSLAYRRVVFISLVCWLPLLLLSALQGEALGGKVAVPFLLDVEVQVRFLVVIPLLVGAEIIVHQRMRFLVAQFLERNLIAKNDVPRFTAVINSAIRLRNSVAAEVLLMAFVYVFGILIIWRQYVALDAATWYAVPSADGGGSSLAGLWFGLVSLPIFQFLLLRWYFRIFIWARLLWQISRIDLCLIPTHPDRAGGLGFLSNTVYAFIPLLVAHGALLAGFIGERIFHVAAKLIDFKLEIFILVIFLLCVVEGPLLVFAPQLAKTKRTGMREFGLLAERYARAFDAKWLRSEVPSDESLLGSADIQSLADLSNSSEVVRTMHINLFSKAAILQFAAAIVAPVVPLLLTMMPLEELLRKLFGILF
jgi:hypothetical protein